MRVTTIVRAPILCVWALQGVWLGCGSSLSSEPPETKAGAPQTSASQFVAPRTQPNGPVPGATPEAIAQARGDAQEAASAVANTPGLHGPVTQAAPPSSVDRALAYDPADPLGDLESADALDRMAQTDVRDVKAPKNGCVVLDPGRRVWPAPGPVALAAVGQGFAFAGYARRAAAPASAPAPAEQAGAKAVPSAATREQVYLVRVPVRGLPEPITAFELDTPHAGDRIAPPGLAARADNDLVLAFTDGARVLRARRLRLATAGHGAPIELAHDVDTRFAPALTASQDRTLIAWTAGGTPMRTFLAVLGADARLMSQRDLTPASMGAAAPAFVAGATPPVLLAVDARNGMSPLLRFDLAADGSAEPGEVVVPLSMVASPPELAAAASSTGTHVAYTGIGSAATTAVGTVAIAPIVGTPEALVPGTGYGQLHVAATPAPRAVLLAAEAPLAGKGKERELHVFVVGLLGRGPATVLKAEGGASHVAIARDEAGYVGVAYSSPGGAHLAILRCDDGE